MSETGAIYVEGLDELLRKMDKLPAEVQRECFKAMQTASLDIIADAKKNLRANGSVVTGNLRASGKVQKVDEKTLDVGFFSSDVKDKGYASYVEYGRKPGKMPPTDILEAWLKKKHSRRNINLNAIHAASVFSGKSMEYLTRQAAWAIAKGIAKNGTKPYPFFEPAVKSGWRKMIDKIAKIVKI